VLEEPDRDGDHIRSGVGVPGGAEPLLGAIVKVVLHAAPLRLRAVHGRRGARFELAQAPGERSVWPWSEQAPGKGSLDRADSKGEPP
jgi:hypothetical protein